MESSLLKPRKHGPEEVTSKPRDGRRVHMHPLFILYTLLPLFEGWEGYVGSRSIGSIGCIRSRRPFVVGQHGKSMIGGRPEVNLALL